MEPETLIESEEIFSRLETDKLLNGYPFTRMNDAVKMSLDESAMTADFVIVTRQNDINRNGHVVQIVSDDQNPGIRLDHFTTNPLVYFDHGMDFTIPIAKSSVPVLQKTKATATATFSQILPEASIYFGLIAEGILNTASISFLPNKAKQYSPKKMKLQEGEIDFKTPYYSFDFVDTELLEWSIVGIPADPGAVRKCLERGSLNGEKISQRMRFSLERMSEKPLVQSGPGPEQLKREREEKQAKKQKEDVKAVVGLVSDCFKPVKQKINDLQNRTEEVSTKLGHYTVAKG